MHAERLSSHNARINSLSQAVPGTNAFLLFQAPGAYTKEAFGVEYLYAQSGFTFPDDEELGRNIDEGFCEELESSEQVTGQSEEWATIASPADLESDDEVQLNFSLTVNPFILHLVFYSKIRWRKQN